MGKREEFGMEVGCKFNRKKHCYCYQYNREKKLDVMRERDNTMRVVGTAVVYLFPLIKKKKGTVVCSLILSAFSGGLKNCFALIFMFYNIIIKILFYFILLEKLFRIC